VCSCLQEFACIQWRSHCSNIVIVFGLNKLDLGRLRSPPLQGGHRLETQGRICSKFSPRFYAPTARSFCAKVRVTCEPNYGVCYGEIDNQWGCFSLHIAVEPPFSDSKWILSVLNSLHLRFSSLYCRNALLPKETLNMGFTVIRYALIWTLSC
jgi:hypothetical protein